MEVLFVRDSFIFGLVWTAIIVLVISFGVTVALLEQDSEEVENISHEKKIEEQVVYQTDQTAIRTNSEGINMKKSLQEKMETEITKLEVKKVEEAIEVEETIETIGGIEPSNTNTRSFIRPVNSEVLRPFSPDELIYSQTLKEWNTHMGTDFKAKLGEEVKVVQAGKVKKVASNDKYGEYIIIEHADGYESLYANITVLDAIKEENEVKQGQVIGYVAESFGFEVAEETHLHFELKKDGKYMSI